MLIRCSQFNFNSEIYKFAADITTSATDITTSATNPKFAAEHAIRQWTLICCSQFNFGSELQIHCRHYNFGGESQIHCRTPNSASNVNSLLSNSISTVNYKFTADVTTSATNPKFAAGHIIRQRILIRCPQFNFGSESQIRCRTHNSATNTNSLLTILFQQRITNSLQTLQLRQRIPNSLQNTSQFNFGNESQIRCRTHICIFNSSTYYIIKSQQSYMVLTWTHTCILNSST